MGVTIIGAGRLGGALARGLRAGPPEGESILLIQRPGPRADALREAGFRVEDRLPSNHRARAIFVVVKPKDLRAVLDDLAARTVDSAPVISLASGMTLAELRERLPGRLSPFRARANVFIARRQGTILLADGPPDGEHGAAVEQLLARLGRVHRVGEAQMVQLTWYSSSVPIVLVAELLRRSLADADAELGDTPTSVVLDGLAGLVAELRERASAGGDLDLSGLVEQIATPGGMNHSALAQLEASGAWDAFERAHATYLSGEADEKP